MTEHSMTEFYEEEKPMTNNKWKILNHTKNENSAC